MKITTKPQQTVPNRIQCSGHFRLRKNLVIKKEMPRRSVSENKLKGGRDQPSSGTLLTHVSQGCTQNTAIRITVNGNRTTATQFELVNLCMIVTTFCPV